MFGVSPEVFYTVYMIFTISKFILGMLYSVVCLGSIIYQTVISFPAIRIDSRAIKLAILR